MGRLKFTLTNIWFWAIIGMTCFFCENVPMIYSKDIQTKGFNLTTVMFLTIIVGIMLFVYYFFEHKRNKVRLDWILGLILLILCISGIIGIWTTNTHFYYYFNKKLWYDFNLTFRDRFIATIETIVTYLFLYGFLFIYSRHLFTKKRILFFSYCYVIFVIIAIIFSLFKDFNSYKRFFDGFVGRHDGYNPTSFFGHFNIFAFSIMIAIFALIGIKTYKPHWWIYPLMIVFCAVCFVCRSTTIFLILLVVIGASIVIDIVCLFRKKPILACITLCLVVFSIIGGMLFVVFSYRNGFKFSVSLYNQLKGILFTKNFDTFSSRTTTWIIVRTILSHDSLNWAFGVGKPINKLMIVNVYDKFGITIVSAHNGFLELLLKGGIVLLVFYCLALLYFVYVCIRLLMKKQFKFVFSYFVCFLGCNVHSLMESTHFFGSTISCIIETLIVFLPPVLLWKNIYKHREIREDVKESNYWQGSLSVQSITRGVAMIFSSLLGICVFTYIIFQSQMAAFKPLMELVIALLILGLVFLPYQIALWHKNSTNVGFLLTLLSWITAFFVLSPLFVVFMYNMTGIQGVDLNTFLRNMTPIVTLILMSLSLFTSMLTKYGSPLKMFKDTFLGVFMTGGISLIFSILALLLGCVYLWMQPWIEILDIILVGVMAFTVYFAVFMFNNFSSSRRIKEELNNAMMFNIRSSIFKEDALDGEKGIN